ncbi:MAG: hypothetical protein GF334_07945 [Candidatus Altiarchaeales archaeon]|nr:hypothetical protein [Candidatus Altiarchaeales archaeon]
MSTPVEGDVPDVIQAIHDKHKETVLAAVAGDEVYEANLWLAVGYFVHGAGRWRKKDLVLSQDQWLDLLIRTGRNPNLVNILPQLERETKEDTDPFGKKDPHGGRP